MRFWVALAFTVLFGIGWIQTRSLQPARESGFLPVEPATPYIRYMPEIPSRGRVLVIHGLNASKEVMQTISAAIADGGFEVYAIDLPGHGDSPVGFEALFAQQTLVQVLEHLGKEITVLGHSLGAGLLLDIAERRPISRMVLLAPPPTPVTEIRTDRSLVVTGLWDLPRIRAFAPIVADAGTPYVELWSLNWAGHSTAIFHPDHIRNIVGWLGGDASRTQTVRRFLGIGLMLGAAAALGVTLLPGTRIHGRPFNVPALLVQYVASCSLAVVLLKVFIPFAWIRLFATDYLVSFVFLTGLWLWLTAAANPLSFGGHKSQGYGSAAAAAAFVILVLGFLAGSHLLHIALSDGRWWRFVVITAASFPLFAFDETTIRRVAPHWKAVLAALLTRALLWAFLLNGVLLLSREAAFLVLIAHLIAAFWIALWLATGIVHRHTQNPFAAAFFAALVQGWAFAVWFVTI